MRRTIIVGIAVFSFLLVLTQYIAYQRYLILKEAKQQYVGRELRGIKDRLMVAIGHSEASVKTLAFIVAEYGIPEQFDRVAQAILQSSPYIDALQLTKKGVITHTFPIEGNEAAIGFDILSDSVRRHEAIHAMQKKEISFAGPVKLKQGGLGIIGRLPIIKNNEFEGFAVVIIKLKTFLKAIGIDTTQQSAFHYQLSKTNPITQQEEFFLAQPIDDDRGMYASIDVPPGDWKIMVKEKSHGRFNFNIAFAIVGLLFSLTGGAFAWHLVQQPERLRQLVNEKTARVIDSEKQFKSTLERVSDGFISYDREWRFRYINTAAERVLGLSADKLIGKNIWEEFPELKNESIYTAYQKAIADQRYADIEFYLPTQEKWLSIHLYPSADGLSVFFRDVTQQKKTEEEITRAYKEKEAILQRISDNFFSLDTEWRYTYLNDAALVDHPAGREATLGRVIWDVHPELRGTIFWDKYHEAWKDKKTVIFESFYAPMKKWFAVKCYPSMDGLTVFYHDVTELKEKDELIKINEARLIEAQSVANVGSWETNLATLQVIWSLQTYHIFELNPATFKPTHTTFLDFVHPHDRDKVNRAFTKSFQDDDWCNIEHRIVTQSGQVKWVEERWRVFQNDKQEPYRAAGTCQDITKRKIAENELQNYTEEIKRLSAHLEQVREDERTRIAREVHDELGQQLTGLKMDVSWLSKKIGSEQTIIHDKLSGMLSLMDHTVKTIRRISSDLRPGILDDLGLVAALEWQSAEFEKQYEIACIFKSEVDDLKTERQLATTVFRIYQEALTNVARHAKATQVESTFQKTSTHMILTVQDNGQGFNDKEVKNKGTLGLIGMRERALMVGCELNLKSKKGAGTIVKLQIPLTLLSPPIE